VGHLTGSAIVPAYDWFFRPGTDLFFQHCALALIPCVPDRLLRIIKDLLEINLTQTHLNFSIAFGVRAGEVPFIIVFRFSSSLEPRPPKWAFHPPLPRPSLLVLRLRLG